MLVESQIARIAETAATLVKSLPDLEPKQPNIKKKICKELEVSIPIWGASCQGCPRFLQQTPPDLKTPFAFKYSFSYLISPGSGNNIRAKSRFLLLTADKLFPDRDGDVGRGAEQENGRN